MKATHEHEWEAAPGLPEALPADERILWQGRPNWWALSVHAFHVRKVAVYFALMIGWQIISREAAGEEPLAIFFAAMRDLSLSVTAICLLMMVAWWSASTTLYTLTDKRVVMRVGIVLSLTFNLPLRCIRGADLRGLPHGLADIALQLPAGDRIGWFHLWPHQRAWQLRHPQPTLRCVPNGQAVGELLLKTWQLNQNSPASRPARASAPDWQGVPA